MSDTKLTRSLFT